MSGSASGPSRHGTMWGGELPLPCIHFFPKQKRHRSDFPLFKPKAQNRRIKVAANIIFTKKISEMYKCSYSTTKAYWKQLNSLNIDTPQPGSCSGSGARCREPSPNHECLRVEKFARLLKRQYLRELRGFVPTMIPHDTSWLLCNFKYWQIGRVSTMKLICYLDITEFIL